MRFNLFQGDCRELLSASEESCWDAIVTDPPYGLEFMGKDWDKLEGAGKLEDPADAGGFQDGAGGNPYSRGRVRHGKRPGPEMQAWHEAWAIEALRVLKPGGHMLVFGGARTYHRMACAIEDAGFEIRDQIMWVYGTGFPKSQNIGKKLDGWDGWGTAVKPAHEPIVVARKPFKGTVAANVSKHGTGAINIDGCRVVEGGRWPANVLHDGSDAVVEQFPKPHGAGKARTSDKGTHQGTGDRLLFGKDLGDPAMRYGDSGSAARFFKQVDWTDVDFKYCAKASKAERNLGLPDGTKNIHPTVKPIALMRYLCRLVTPPNGAILDPFMGSGSTGMAALAEGFRFTGIELDPTYFALAKTRLEGTSSPWPKGKEE